MFLSGYNLFGLVFVFSLFSLFSLSCSDSQPRRKADILISNARILDQTGELLEGAYIAIKDGRIMSINSGKPNFESEIEIDATGRTVVPGLIETHRHILPSKAESKEDLELWMQEELPALLDRYLSNGITTIMSTGDTFPAILEVKERINSGYLHGPRLFAVGPVFTSPNDWSTPIMSPWTRSQRAVEVDHPENAKERVRVLAEAGVDGIKAIIDRGLVPNTTLSYKVLAAIVEEAHKYDLPVLLHVGKVKDVIAAIETGVDRLVHMPGRLESISETGVAHLLKEADVPVSTTTWWGAKEGVAVFGGRERTEEQVSAHEQVLANVRHLWDEGVTVAFGTDLPNSLGLNFLVEARSLSEELSNKEILMAMTKNAAAYLDLEEDLGTLAEGKIADLLILTGDPLTDIMNLSGVEMVIKDGVVVVDNR